MNLICAFESSDSPLSFALIRFIIRAGSSEISAFPNKYNIVERRNLRGERKDYESKMCIRKFRISAFICAAQIDNPFTELGVIIITTSCFGAVLSSFYCALGPLPWLYFDGFKSYSYFGFGVGKVKSIKI